MPAEEKSLHSLQPECVIPAGTQVVLKVPLYPPGEERDKAAGAVGVVLEVPPRHDGVYAVRFADGKLVQAMREQLAVRRREIDDLLQGPDEDFTPCIIYRCRVGSQAFGLAGEESDDDLRGIFLPPAARHWSLFALPEQVEFQAGERDEVYWELEKFVRLALKANPNILETLWTPLVLHADEIARELRALRRVFLSRHLYKTYSGYVLSQFRRMAAAFRSTGQFKPKHAMHLIRLLHSGIAALEMGEILIDASPWREKLLAIKRGEWVHHAVSLLSLPRLFWHQAGLMEKSSAKSAKDLLYAYRVLLTGTHLLRTGEVEANIRILNETFRLPFIDDLIAQKVAEKVALPNLDWEFHARELARLEQQMDAAFTESKLPEERDRAALSELLVQTRMVAPLT